MATRDDLYAEDYEAYVAGRRRRFAGIVRGALLALVWALYLPWMLVAYDLMTHGLAEIMTCFSGLLMFIASPVLLARQGRSFLGVAVVGEIIVFCAVSWWAGWISVEGVRWTVMLCFVLAAGAARALLGTALRRG